MGIVKLKGNPLYKAWKAEKYVRGHSISGWDRPMMRDFDAKKYMKQFQYDLVLRERMVRTYSWSIPTPQAIKWIAGHARNIVEIGAGRGYWASLLDKAGVHINAFDSHVRGDQLQRNGWHEPHPMWADKDAVFSDDLYYPVLRGGPTWLRSAHNGWTLFLCWPPHSSQMASSCLRYYQGDAFIYCGPLNGACASDAFWKRIDREWSEDDECDIPTWPNQQDRLVLFARKK